MRFNLNQLYFKSVTERFSLDLHSFSETLPLPKYSVAIKNIYESAVKDIEKLYKKVEDESYRKI